MFVFGSSLFINIVLLIGVSVVKRRMKNDFGESFETAVILSGSGILSFSMATNAAFLLKAELMTTWMILLIGGIVIGIGLGALFRETSLFVGGYHGMIGGLMGTMLSAIILNPSLCSLPTESVHRIEQNSQLYSVFSTILSVVTYCLLYVLCKIHLKKV